MVENNSDASSVVLDFSRAAFELTLFFIYIYPDIGTNTIVDQVPTPRKSSLSAIMHNVLQSPSSARGTPATAASAVLCKRTAHQPALSTGSAQQSSRRRIITSTTSTSTTSPTTTSSTY
jgi:hypothetical protein